MAQNNEYEQKRKALKNALALEKAKAQRKTPLTKKEGV